MKSQKVKQEYDEELREVREENEGDGKEKRA